MISKSYLSRIQYMLKLRSSEILEVLLQVKVTCYTVPCVACLSQHGLGHCFLLPKIRGHKLYESGFQGPMDIQNPIRYSVWNFRCWLGGGVTCSGFTLTEPLAHEMLASCRMCRAGIPELLDTCPEHEREARINNPWTISCQMLTQRASV